MTVIGIWTMTWLAGCSGSGAGDGDEIAYEEALIGSWRVVPQEGEIRRLKVIDAAMSGQPDKTSALGDLTKAEKALFAEWSAKRGAEAENMKAELRFLAGAQLSFTEEQVTVQFGSNTYGPADYAILGADKAGVQVRFDPGLGNGMETHDIQWTSADAGIDIISSTRRGAFAPLSIRRQ